MKRKYSILIVVLLILSLNQLLAAPVSGKMAKIVAENFYKSQFYKMKGFIPNYHAITINTISNENEIVYYVVNFSQGGFVIISADDHAFPIIGFSLEDNFPDQILSQSLENWMSNVKKQINIAAKSKLNSPFSSVWNSLLDEDYTYLNNKNEVKGVGELLTLRWDQGVPYNNQCPPHAQGPGGHCLTGCVATAMAQIMKYWNYPERGKDSILYTGNNNLDFEHTYYNWDAMTNIVASYSPDSSKNAVAQLMFHCGATVNMMYGPDASGTFTELVPQALIHYFRYHPSAGYMQRSHLSDKEWDLMVRENLDNYMPVLYSGEGTGGHAFVCDGYTDTCWYHFNWGWSGAGNGYFYYNDLSPGSNDFSQGQGAVFNIMPYFGAYCRQGRVLNDVDRTIDDGSYLSYYWNNTNCDWLIAPTDPDAKITLSFITFNTESNADFVSVYDGSDASAPLLGTYSGDQVPPVMVSSAGRMYLTFNSNQAGQAPGWEAYYDARFCREGGMLTDEYSVFSDGSDNLNYLNNSHCEWLIAPPDALEKITLIFTSFSIQDTLDYVTIYDGDDVTDPLLGRFSGSQIPDTIVSTAGNMLVIFESNATIRSEGWTARYYSGNLDVSEMSIGNTSFTFYPNPVMDRIYFKMNDIISWNGIVSIFNITGELVSSYNISLENSEPSFIDLSELPKGFYFFKVKNNQGEFVRRFVKE